MVNMDIHTPAGNTFSQVREIFDEILVKRMGQIPRPVIVDKALTFNLAALTTLLLLVEREKEMKMFIESPPERYTRATFMEDMSDIGLEVDDDLMVSIQDLETNGFFSIGSDSRFYVKKPAFVMTNILDSVFSGMPGMSLVAYTIQTIQEVVSGRKELEFAIRQFDGMLVNCIARVKKPRTEIRNKRDLPTRKKADLKDAPETVKQIYIEKLTKSQSRPSGTAAPQVFTTDSFGGKVVVKEIFPKKKAEAPISPFKKEATADTAETRSASGEDGNKTLPTSTGTELPPPSDTLSLPEGVADFLDDSLTADTADTEPETTGLEGPPAPPDVDVADFEKDTDDGTEAPSASTPDEPEIPDEAPAVAQHPVESDVDGSQMAEEPAVSAPESPPHLPSVGPEQIPSSHAAEAPAAAQVPPVTASTDSTGKRGLKDSVAPTMDEKQIEQRVQAFEEALALSCPLCRKGRITPRKTETDKIYYACSDEGCRFISWGKPHPRECPDCRNPFLIEFTRQGETGLKCPRATCDYVQRSNANRPKPRKKVVKKVVVRKS